MSNTAATLIFVSAATVYPTLLLVKTALAARVIRQQRRWLSSVRSGQDSSADATHSATVSLTIAQPVLSGDPLLSDKLQFNYRAMPETVDILWLVDHSDTVGCRMAEQLLNACPRARLLRCEDASADVNPKSFKLQVALDHATTEYFAVLDDDTTITPHSLRAAIQALDHSQLYTGLPCYDADAGFWSKVLAHFVNNNAVLTYLPLLNFAPPVTINGMFYVLRTQAWKSIGGFAAIHHELCDDYAVYRHARRHGWKILQGITAQQVQTSVRSCGHYRSMMHRWMLFARLLFHDQSRILQSILLLFLALPPVLLWLMLICGVLQADGGPAIVMIVCVLVLRHLSLVAVHRLAFSGGMQFSILHSLLAELLQPLHALHAACSKTIRWRSRLIRVTSNHQFLTEQDSVR